jgi:hypothetical protein
VGPLALGRITALLVNNVLPKRAVFYANGPVKATLLESSDMRLHWKVVTRENDGTSHSNGIWCFVQRQARDTRAQYTGT